MAVGVVTWSKTPASNDVADTSVNWAEGQAPSSVNDSARAMMAAAAKWRDDITGVNVTGGSGTAYTLTTSQIFASNTDGYTVQFTPGSTNTGAVTLAVDGNTARALRFLTGTDLPAGVLISGSLYQASYRAATTEWLLHSSPLAQPFLVPLGGIIEYPGATAPTNFALCYGQTLSQTTYATLFSLVSTTYNTGGEPGGTFRIPDLRGRVVAGKDDMGGSGAGRLQAASGGLNGTILGNGGGADTQTLSLLQVPGGITAANASQSISVAISSGFVMVSGANTVTDFPSTAGSGLRAGGNTTTLSSSQTFNGSNSISVSANNTGASGNGVGAAAAHTIVQPTFILNKIMRVI